MRERVRQANPRAHRVVPEGKWRFDAPVAKAFNDMLERAGFNQVDCFWRWCNFAGWVAIK